MWIELATLSAGALGYRLWRSRPVPEKQNRVLPTTQHRPLRQLWRDIREALQATGQNQLHGAISPAVQQQLQAEKERAQRQQKFGLCALALAISGAYFPVMNLISTAAVLYLTKDILKLIRKDFQRGHYFTFQIVSLIMICWMLASGRFIFAAVSAIITGFLARIVNRMEEASHYQLINVFCDRPEQIWIMVDDAEIQIPFQDLQAGDQVIVHPGEIIPIDGIITAGHGQVDQHILTGESQPVEKTPGHEVFAATLLLSGQLHIQVQTTGEATLAAKIGTVLSETQSYKDNLTTRGCQIANQYLPVTIGLSVLTLPVLGSESALAMLWANLGGLMATLGPLSVMSYLQILSRRNILIKDGRVFELLRDVDTVVFDKTGTLTLEQPTVSAIRPFGHYTETDVLRYAAVAEYRQPHPVAKAILARAAAEQLELPIPDTANYNLGYGIRVHCQDDCIQVGSARFLQQQGVVLPDTLQALQAQSDEHGHSLIYVAVNQELAGILTLQPTIRPEAAEIVQFLQQRNIRLYIISGDHAGPTRSLAQSLGIQHYFSGVLPEHKADYVEQLQAQGRFVCFVGDGINDAIALKKAHVSLSLSGASSAATDTAQVVLMDGTLAKVPEFFRLGDQFEQTMQKNLVISFVPGFLIIPGIYLLHTGLAVSMAIWYVNTFIGLGNVLWSLIKHREIPETGHHQNDSVRSDARHCIYANNRTSVTHQSDINT